MPKISSNIQLDNLPFLICIAPLHEDAEKKYYVVFIAFGGENKSVLVAKSYIHEDEDEDEDEDDDP